MYNIHTVYLHLCVGSVTVVVYLEVTCNGTHLSTAACRLVIQEVRVITAGGIFCGAYFHIVFMDHLQMFTPYYYLYLY